MQRGKKYRAAAEKIDSNRVYSVGEAVKLIKENKIAKFDESVEIHVKTNIDPKKGEQQVRGTVVLPHGTGKTKKIAVVTSTQAEAAKKAGADIVGGEEIIEKLAKKINFDILIATPEMMPKLAKVAKILGPKGLMPNPKSETVTTKIAETVAALKKGKAAFKNDDTGNIHQVVGKISFTETQLQENIQIFLTTLEKSKPAGLKGRFVSGVAICSTMGKGIKINL
jgi:large subunit ribosomal protein L1